ncbi:hypothetical protein CLV46_2918 [Diaminobutyricimonas aerilata]|uniref:Uncharacterized protein n=1 Tax=Diaminobutyricimonas aerilata TaxID=1162967 RepID=A0A2M9CN71_9MICO|nr:hypothetical protein [Diaminobutyricimonas aerilata]PJJ73332.1 hypothetical protein CLV46_2918 [Diaminobutyricimonas aerilata]
MTSSPPVPTASVATSRRATGTSRSSIPAAAALLASLLGLAAAALWLLELLPYPFASEPGTLKLAVAEFLPRGVMIAGVALLGAVGAAIALRMLRASHRTGVAPTVMAGAVLAVTVLVVADARLMAFLGYALSLRMPPLDDQIATQAAFVVGGLLWLGAAVSGARRGRRRVHTDGRPASRTARAAAIVALLVPLVYASTRFAWAAGIPLGISDDMMRQGQQSGLWLIGLGLALVATVGGLLALGLVQRWGERFPRWVPVLGERRVPVLLAVIPASVAAASITASGIGFVRVIVSGEMPLTGNWTTIGPELLWPLWGVALAVATVAYARRRVAWAPRAELTAW